MALLGWQEPEGTPPSDQMSHRMEGVAEAPEVPGTKRPSCSTTKSFGSDSEDILAGLDILSLAPAADTLLDTTFEQDTTHCPHGLRSLHFFIDFSRSSLDLLSKM